MQVLNTGTTYRIYDETMRAFTKLPPAVYKVSFNQMTGYSLVKTDDLSINEKIYGQHLEKVEKVFKTFEAFNRNLGIILSGDKGIGKSLFAKLLSIKATLKGYPIIICDAAYPGIADFLGSIQQEVVILFDEFDKTFAARGKDNPDAQADMLTLFDGLYMGKKMFVITCNDLYKLSDYLVNRPGRFHYHFRFTYPVKDEIVEYMRDHVDEQYWSEIDNVVEFANKIELNFDCLRAIAFELNMGYTFADAAKDLNIINFKNDVSYNLFLYFKDGTVFTYKDLYIDIFRQGEIKDIWMEANKNEPELRINFDPSNNYCDYNKGGMVINNADITIANWDINGYDSEQREQLKARKEQLEKIGIDFMLVKKVDKGDTLHYAI